MEGANLWSLLLTVGIGLIAYLLKEWKSSVETKAQEERKEVKELKDKFADLRAHLPAQYVSRDDFIRAIAGLDNRLDNGLNGISKQIMELTKEIQQRKGD